MLWLPVLLAGVARAGCDGRTLMDLAAQADAAFQSMDAAAFSSTANALEQTLGCVEDPLSAAQVVAYHRTRALTAFFDGDDASAILSFQAALATMPGYDLPEDVAPAGHPLRALFEQARLFAAGETVELPEPASGWITVDGTRTRAAPAARPFVFQRLDPTGRVLDTRYVTVGTPMPTYPARAPTLPTLDPVREHQVHPKMIVGGGAIGVLAIAAYGAAFATRGEYDHAVVVGDTPKIRSYYAATNGLVGGGIGLGVLGTTLVLVGAF